MKGWIGCTGFERHVPGAGGGQRWSLYGCSMLVHGMGSVGGVVDVLVGVFIYIEQSIARDGAVVFPAFTFYW